MQIFVGTREPGRIRSRGNEVAGMRMNSNSRQRGRGIARRLHISLVERDI